MIHNCQLSLGPGLRDGQRKKCVCGKVFEFVADEMYGCAWVPFIAPVRDDSERRKARKKREHEALRVWSANTGKDVRTYPRRGRWKNRRKAA